MTGLKASVLKAARRLRCDTSGVALLEFAFTMPIILTMGLTGAELTNYIITKMRVSQIALHLADNAARIGSGTQLQAKTISETDINDLFTGAGLQSGELDLFKNGRVILSDLEVDPDNAGKYKIKWQRCRGAKTAYTPRFGTYNKDSGKNMDGMGPANRMAMAPADGAAMFVEVYYVYQPLIRLSFAPTTEFKEIASMMVRDRRDLTRIYNNENATVASC